MLYIFRKLFSRGFFLPNLNINFGGSYGLWFLKTVMGKKRVINKFRNFLTKFYKKSMKKDTPKTPQKTAMVFFWHCFSPNNFKYMILIWIFFLDAETPPSHFSKNLFVLSHPRQNPLLMCIVPKIWSIWSICLLLSCKRNMKVKLAPLSLTWPNFLLNSSRG